MAFSEQYRRQVGLLVQVLPLIAKEACFALKGGTAINLFDRDLPRLSVDIDLTYLLVEDRASSLRGIDSALRRIAKDIREELRPSDVELGVFEREATVTKLVARQKVVQVKVEVTPVLRGCVYQPEARAVSPRVEREFGYAKVQVVSFADLYAGKIVAALDRQHPRDLFDLRDLLANQRINDNLRTAFVVYLLSHNRPLAELLAPARKDIAQEFEGGFSGMTEAAVSLDELLQVRERLIDEMVAKMPQPHRDLLLSFERGEPNWSLLGVKDVENLPAVRWRQENLSKVSGSKRNELVKSLEQALHKQG